MESLLVESGKLLNDARDISHVGWISHRVCIHADATFPRLNCLKKYIHGRFSGKESFAVQDRQAKISRMAWQCRSQDGRFAIALTSSIRVQWVCGICDRIGGIAPVKDIVRGNMNQVGRWVQLPTCLREHSRRLNIELLDCVGILLNNIGASLCSQVDNNLRMLTTHHIIHSVCVCEIQLLDGVRGS